MTAKLPIALALGVAAVGATALAVARRKPDLLSLAELAELTPRLDAQTRRKYLPLLNAALHEWSINTPNRIAHALGQWLHESWQLTTMVEIGPDVQRYASNPHLGNGGDAAKAASYIGRGPTQLTGLANYTRAGKALGVDLVNVPELAADPRVGFRAAGWYFREGNGDLAPLADRGTTSADILAITKRINGGTNGLLDRERYTHQVAALLARRRSKT
ncbi:class I chitinase [Myxococcus stipitatus DSM 14675]|uniref:Class I chitinase n=1 Tax=Myxococcus stipitatus (strain DSM 14675 / JCM 12634 / Mx s8) TaxID=1278073 RepID=L7UBP9_MYXSD|nr:glycoside hydrolase family 19 protein [Myxococcus stipitatus]AGC45463.1 class I chitinase [Myxococcus stipitatus DSM 14675]